MATLPPKQAKAATLISQGLSLKAVASELKISPKALYNWRRSPAFIETMDRLILAEQAVALQGLHILRSKAVAVLDTAMESDNESIQLKAACEVLNRTLAPMPLSPVVTDELQKRQRWDAVIQSLQQRKTTDNFQTGMEVECVLKS